MHSPTGAFATRVKRYLHMHASRDKILSAIIFTLEKKKFQEPIIVHPIASPPNRPEHNAEAENKTRR